jgi:hypothetical protein
MTPVMRHHRLAALLVVAVCALLAAGPTKVAGSADPVPAFWKKAVCGQTPSADTTVASAEDLVEGAADSSAGSKYLVSYSPGVGCMLFYVKWDGTNILHSPILVGTSQVAATVGSAYTCTFFKSSAVPVPAKLTADFGAAFPTSFAAVKPRTRCSFALYTSSSTDFPVDESDASAGNYGTFQW